MSSALLTSQIGQRIFLPGHFDVPVVLEDARPLDPDDSAGYECRVRLPDGSLEEAVISAEEAAAVVGLGPGEAKAETPVDAEKLRLPLESARIRLAYAHDQQFAVSLSGIRTQPHRIEAVYQAMLPQPRLRFLPADDPGAGKPNMAGLPVKELKLRQAIERILFLCPAPLTIQWQDDMLRYGRPAPDYAMSHASSAAPGGVPGRGVCRAGTGVAVYSVSLRKSRTWPGAWANGARTSYRNFSTGRKADMAKRNKNLPAPQAPRQAGGANLGFEAKLWAAAHALRHNMDAAEYYRQG